MPGRETKWAQTTGEKIEKKGIEVIGVIISLSSLTAGEGDDMEFSINSDDTVEQSKFLSRGKDMKEGRT